MGLYSLAGDQPRLRQAYIQCSLGEGSGKPEQSWARLHSLGECSGKPTQSWQMLRQAYSLVGAFTVPTHIVWNCMEVQAKEG